ncbi:DUF6185 family protein [Streptomyces sp. NPDC005271]|uniref:DUF6185 family protein n=1 Tax=unclassified Streptomyces TaxID=2593676 RepID=UPI0033A971FB
MTTIRWRRWLALVIVVAGWWGLWPTEGCAAPSSGCQVGGVARPKVEALIEFSHHGQTFVQAQATTNVTVEKGWDLADKLTLSEKSEPYRHAMRCLLRRVNKVNPRPLWRDEWHLHRPKVSQKGEWVTVHYEAFALIKHEKHTRIGPWDINVTEGGKTWEVALQREPLGQAATKARWKSVKVKLGGLDAYDASPKASYADNDTRRWNLEKDGRERANPGDSKVSIRVVPPWHASFAMESARQSFLSKLGVVLWWVCGSGAFALAVLRTRPRPSAELMPYASWSPWRSRNVDTGPQERPTLAALLLWAGLSAALGLALTLLFPKAQTFTIWHTVIGILAGVILILAARPWFPNASPKASESESEKRDHRAKAWTRDVIFASSLLTAFGLVALLAPGRVGLPGALTPPGSGVAALMVLELVMLWVWLASMAAWAWRFARDGGLVRPYWAETWGKAPIRCIGAVGTALAVVAVAMLFAYRWSVDLDWQRANWLIDDVDGYDSAHAESLRNALVAFGPASLAQVYAYTWVLTVIALVALLNTRAKTADNLAHRKSEQISLGPSQIDMRLTAVIFAIVAATRVYLFAGSSLLLVVWLVLNIVALYAVRAMGRRWSVLPQTGGDSIPEGLGTEQGRHDMLEKAHQYRNLHHQLRIVDQGRTEKDATRETLENRLRQLRHWRPPGCGRDCLPDHVSVVDVALSWGPRDKWWDNALQAARLAFFFGIPASAALVWAKYLSSAKQLMLTSASPTGPAEILASFLTWQIAWAGVGLALGALWRMLPGRRGPMRALSLTLAYAIPIGIGALVNRITDTELGNAVLSASLMLIVLTLTSIWLDMATFSRERQLWPTRLSLLLSIYQVRTISAQAAFLLAQLAAAASIWKELSGPPLNF